MHIHTQPVALITGASRGIGAATAHELAQRGYALVLAARSSEALTALAGELTRQGTPALPIPTDLCNTNETQRLVRLALEHFGHIDALIHNAGIGNDNLVVRIDQPNGNAILTTNLLAPIALTHMLLPHMLARRSGAIVFVSSVLGHIGMPGSAHYAASKFGLRGFALALRREVDQHGIGVSIISPGFIKTDMTRWLGNMPMPGPHIVARAIANAIIHPRRERIVPVAYRVLIWLEHLFPGLGDRVLRWRAR